MFPRSSSPKSICTSSPLESSSCSFSSPSLLSSSSLCCSIGKTLDETPTDKVKWNQFLRFGTISHILASTDLNCCTKKEDVLSDEALIEKNAVEIVKQMQRLKGIDGDYDSDSAASNRLAQRHTIQVDKDLIFPICVACWLCLQWIIFSLSISKLKSAQNLERNRQKKRAIGTLDVAFKKRFFALSGIVEPELGGFVSTIRSWELTQTLSTFQERRTPLEAKLTERQSRTISIVRKLIPKSN